MSPTLEQMRKQTLTIAQREFAGEKKGNKKKYVVVCGEYAQKYVCGVFNNSEKATEYVRSISKKLNPEIIEVVAKKYPIYIVEDHRKLLFTDDFIDITKKIKSTKKIKDFDDCYFTFYIIGKSFSTDKGIDQMGALDHIHVTDRELVTTISKRTNECPRCFISWKDKQNTIVLNDASPNTKNTNYIQCLNCGTSWVRESGNEANIEIVPDDFRNNSKAELKKGKTMARKILKKYSGTFRKLAKED